MIVSWRDANSKIEQVFDVEETDMSSLIVKGKMWLLTRSSMRVVPPLIAGEWVVVDRISASNRANVVLAPTTERGEVVFNIRMFFGAAKAKRTPDEVKGTPDEDD